MEACGSLLRFSRSGFEGRVEKDDPVLETAENTSLEILSGQDFSSETPSFPPLYDRKLTFQNC